MMQQKKILEGNSHKVDNYDKLKSGLEKGGFYFAPWCGKEACEEKIKEETGADIRVILFEDSGEKSKCIICQETSVSIPIFARGY